MDTGFDDFQKILLGMKLDDMLKSVPGPSHSVEVARL